MIDQRLSHKPGGVRVGMLCFRLGCSSLLSGGDHIQLPLFLTVLSEYGFKHPADNQCCQHQQQADYHYAGRTEWPYIEGDAPALEKTLHDHLENYRINRVNLRKEFFRVELSRIIDEVERHHGKVEYIADPVTPEQVDLLRQQTALPQNVIARTQQQLNRLDKLPPGWSIDYSRQLVEQAQALWPEQAKSLAQQWQQQRSAAALPAEQLNGWSQGMMTLQKLSDRLNGLDEQKGKYITVSELKSVVFATMQFFNQSIPAEEQLRVLSQHPAGKPLPAAAQSQLEMHLKQLTARYAELKQQAEK
ncbi:hypothetical protein G5574_07045 [Pantoea stewartii]|nr:hypothetical protein G5574_07045 [Pantoea stewartii]